MDECRCWLVTGLDLKLVEARKGGGGARASQSDDNKIQLIYLVLVLV